MAPPHRHRRYYRDPDQRAADAGAGCILALLFIIIFFPLIWLYQASRIQKPYKPWAIDVPVQKTWRRTFADYNVGDWIIYICVWGVMLFVAFPLMNGNAGTGFIVLGVAMIVALAWEWVRHHDMASEARRRTEDNLNQYPDHVLKSRTYTIYPVQSKPDLVASEKLIRALLSSMPHVTLQIVAEPDRIVWQVVDPHGSYTTQVVLDTLKSYLDANLQVEVTEGIEDSIQSRFPYYREHVYFWLANDYVAPLPFVTLLKDYDPLTSLTQRMDLLQGQYKERLMFQIVVMAASEPARKIGAKRYEQGNIVALPGIPRDREKEETGLNDRLIEAKLADTLYHCFVGVTIESEAQERLIQLRHVAEDIGQYSIPGHNHLAKSEELYTSARPNIFIEHIGYDIATRIETTLLRRATKDDSWQTLLAVLSPAEIAALWHLPSENFTAKHIAWAGRPIPAQLTDVASDQVVIGTTITPGPEQNIYLANLDRAHHAYITGKTGMGKSTLIHNLVHQDIAAGRGVIVIDPHGKLTDDILATSIPASRVSDVVILECGNSEYPVPLNPFRISEGVSFDTAFNYLYWVVKKLYSTVWRERMDLVYRNVLQALLCDPQATPLDIELLFNSAPYRAYICDQISQHPHGTTALERFWREFSKRSRSEQADIANPILNRTAIFLGNRALEVMMCHPQTLNFQRFIETKQIVLINLSGEAIRSEVGNLGALFLANIYLASEALGYLPDSAPPRCYLYVDEVDRMISTPIPEMFAHERKFGLSLTLANQYLDQLSDDTLYGILGNVGTNLIFETSQRDARILSSYFASEFDRLDLLNLGAHRMLVKTRFEGRTLPSFEAKTCPPPARQTDVPLEQIREEARNRHGFMTATEVRHWLNDHYMPTPPADVSPQPEPKASPLQDYE